MTIRDLMEKFPNNLDTVIVIGCDGPFTGTFDVDDVSLDNDEDHWMKRCNQNPVIFISEYGV